MFSAPTTQFVTFDSVKKGQHEAGLEGAKFGDRPSFIIEVSQSNAESILKVIHNLFLESSKYFTQDGARQSSKMSTVESIRLCSRAKEDFQVQRKCRLNVSFGLELSVWNIF